MRTTRKGLPLRAAIVALVAVCTGPAVAVATTPPPSTTMAEAVVATRDEATHLMEEFADAGLEPSAAEMEIAACEDRAQMHHPKATVRFTSPYGRPVEPADVEAVVELLVDDGWSATESPRFDEGIDDSNPTGYTVSAARGEHRIIFRIFADGTRGWFDLLGACLDSTDDERRLYLELLGWALPVPAPTGTAASAPASTVVP